MPAPGFSFNQYLIVDDEPLLFHTGLRKMFPLVSEAVATVIQLIDFVTFLFHTSRRTNAGRLTSG
jgi:flavorubredoxin